jgi:hypothetical protein
MIDKFCVFILSHGRPNKIPTIHTLNKCGYTGNYYIVVDNEDKDLQQYIDLYGDKVIVFDKAEKEKTFDTYDNFGNRNVVVHARNVCFDIAEKLGYDYFLELDDDYVRFEYRWEQNKKLMTQLITNLDAVVVEMLTFLENTGAKCVAFAQGGDFIGGVGSANFKKGCMRKTMNTLFCKTNRRFDFVGRMNDDVNTYCTLGNRGDLFLSIAAVDIVQIPTQANSGGLSEAYLETGTFTKSFYSVMGSPSFVSIQAMGPAHSRLHHIVDWETAVPKIISDKFKK